MSQKRCLKRSRTASQTAVKEQKQRPICVFCKTDTKNKYYLGKMLCSEDICAHYYCILFAPGLRQNGALDEGIKGFLVNDIKKEVRRGGFLSCSYCGQRGAVVGCALNDCKIKFHLTCGLRNNSFHNFHHNSKSFPSLCCQHRPNQRITRIAKKCDDLCAICREHVTTRPTPLTLWSPCCGQWFHRECVQKQAYHAAKHHFKCPKCNDTQQFAEEMKAFGIHVPSRDASWERGHQFQELYQKSYSCGADLCLCRKSRTFNGDHEWEILACDGCGANATHIKCAKLSVGSEEWFCDVCKPVLSAKRQKVLKEN